MKNRNEPGQRTGEKPGPKVVNFHERKTVRAQASDWIARLEINDCSAKDMNAFSVWVNESLENRSEFERLSALWGDLNVLTELELPSGRAQRPMTFQLIFQWFAGGLTWAGASLAATALFVGLTVLLWQQGRPEYYQTAIGEQQVIVLPDKSIINLNTNSRLKVDYSASRRGIYLMQGEAHFDVEKDVERPFEVHAAKGLVRAVGTAFNVHMRSDDVEVIVSEGIVELDAVSSIEGDEQPLTDDNVRLLVGEQATFLRVKPEVLVRESGVDFQRKLGWRTGSLEFKRDLLSDVVTEVSRYTEKDIVIVDEEARQLRVGGRFKIGDVDVLLEVLSSGFGIEVSREENNVIYLSYAKG